MLLLTLSSAHIFVAILPQLFWTKMTKLKSVLPNLHCQNLAQCSAPDQAVNPCGSGINVELEGHVEAPRCFFFFF